jgi:hypothetical protein
VFARISPDAPLFNNQSDPAAGPNSPHIEFTFRVSRWSLYESISSLTVYYSSLRALRLQASSYF